jgi:FtsK/SpoIIIE family
MSGMGGAGNNAKDGLELAAGALGALWRWRVELVLLALPVAAWLLLTQALGALAAGAVVAWALAGVLASPGSRAALLRWLRATHTRRRFWRARVDVGLAPVRLGRLRTVPAGDVASIRVSSGGSVADVEARGEQLAASIGLRELRVLRDPADASRGTVVLVRRDPLAARPVAWPHADADGLSLWNPIPVGVDELGDTVSISLPERNVLLGGEPGAGKSAALSLIVATAALDRTARLWLLDGKLVELSAWAPCAERLAGPDVDEAIELLRAVRAEMEQRYRVLLAAGRRNITPGDGLALHLVACDELAFYLSCEDRKRQREVSELLRDLVARGRAAGVIVCAATQKPASDVVPSALRDLFGFRLALRCNTPQASDTILGQGWATAGADASTIPAGQRGVGYLLAEGERPERIKGYHLSDDGIASIAERAAARRADAWLAAGTPVEPERQP